MSQGPPYRITTDILTRIAQIAEAVGHAEAGGLSQDLRLRRINRIRTIQGSLAIEGNILTEEQISTILEGKPVVAPLRDVQEARNAIKAYDWYEAWDPAREADLLNAHEILMAGLVDAPGRYRRGRVAVMGQDGIQHVGPPAGRVPSLMAELLAWLRGTDDHPLIASSVFHYEFEFIHPFEDGNGRMGRLWQTLILTGWKTLFAHVPVESLVRARQSEYYTGHPRELRAGREHPFRRLHAGHDSRRGPDPPGRPPCYTPSQAPRIRPGRGDVSARHPPRSRSQRPQVAAAALPDARAAGRVRGDDPSRRTHRPEPEVPADLAGATAAVDDVTSGRATMT